MTYSFENKYPLWKITEGVPLKSGQIIINDEIVQTWPDNDGGVWYYDKEGREVHIR